MEGRAPGSRQSVSAQGMALAQRTDGDIGTLRPRHFTPSEVALPTSPGAGAHRGVGGGGGGGGGGAVHQPMSIALAAQQRLAAASEPRIARVVLDGFLLLESTGMALPDDVRQASLPDRLLGSVVEEDLQFFSGLIVLDVSENALELAPFGALPRLKELRIACNGIQKIEDLFGYDHLAYLDLSYNRLTTRSVQSLDVLPNLKDLDLSGNNLRGLPKEMYRFRSLERLIIDNNKMDDNVVFSILCTVPNLRFLSAAHNYLYKFAPECCSEGYFRMLSTLDLSFNYFGAESDVQPIIELPRLTTVMLYGNPLLGPKGEDPTFIYIEDLVETASEVRLSSKRQEIDWVTEVPRSRILKKGVPAGRKATYRDFSIVHVDAEFAKSKNAHEWREAGNQTLFAEAIAIARKEQMAVRDHDSTFITAGMQHHHDDEELANSIADNVMDRVADEMGLRSSAEILHMRDRVKLGRTAASMEEEEEQSRQRNQNQFQFPLRNPYDGERDYATRDDEEGRGEGEGKGDGEAAAAAAGGVQDKVPSTLFGRSMGNPQTLTTHPVAVKTAMRALQFALRHPMTNHNEVPAKGLLPPKDYVRPTLSSINRKMPRKEPYQPAHSKLPEDLQAKKDAGKGLPEPFAVTHSRRVARENTLHQIEGVLDSLNKYSDNLLAKKATSGATTSEQIEQMKGFARPTTGLRSLVQMVEEVVTDLDR